MICPFPLLILGPTITMFRITLGISRAITIVFTFNMVVACTTTQDPPAQTFGDPIEGVWLLGDDQSPINIAPCSSDKEDGLCGTLTQMPDDEDAWSSQINAKWWQDSLSPTVTQLRPTEIEGEYVGFIYNSDIAETLYLQLVLANDRTIEAVVYFGADLDEAVDIAIGAVFSPVKMTDLAWFLTRAGVGKTWLSNEQTWRRPES
ncbi:hypothetical protein [Thalassobius sp. I31.1]|uniref:hypothetical protein n=1 Tax=Thalassobius sp. I31.1 TaxID=2109912 RepID=UPI000D1A70A0|nr:hypothetical protein [Thalassobius sp. I31.1]